MAAHLISTLVLLFVLVRLGRVGFHLGQSGQNEEWRWIDAVLVFAGGVLVNLVLTQAVMAVQMGWNGFSLRMMLQSALFMAAGALLVVPLCWLFGHLTRRPH